ncbi:MAG: SpoIVB peptidase [Ruminococcaceae bacterium]|nr:SpoIVB peptidase [Oscillospiraceae bacterium]
MRLIRGIVKAFFYFSLAVCIFIFSMIFYLDNTLKEEYKISRGEILKINTFVPITAEYNGTSMSGVTINNSGNNRFAVELKMFGAIPFSTVDVEVVDEIYVAVLGNPFGIRLYTEGVLVIDMTDVSTAGGMLNPASDAGLRKGDYILTANGDTITCNEDIAAIVADSNGRDIKLEIKRNGKKKTLTVTPALSSETKNYQIGIWVRDSSAGIGTLTFYSPANNVICGLGHGICDNDTGDLLSVETGQLVTATISAVQKGTSGSPGELKGAFKGDVLSGIDLNCEIGVYGELNGNINISALTEVALGHEVKNGSAQILCTVNGDTPKLYSCNVKKRISTEHSPTQNLTVTVTDPELLKITGGIVQGMSGSPIIQNGKLIGAVTHVLVDDPTKGYAIFAENMLETAQSVAENNKLKEAS